MLGEAHFRPRRTLAALGLAVAVALSATATPTHARELTLDESGGFIVPVEINGASLRLRVDPAASGLIVLNPAAAKKAGLRDGAITPEMARKAKYNQWSLDPDALPMQSSGGANVQRMLGRTAEAGEMRIRTSFRFGPVGVGSKAGMAKMRVNGSSRHKLFIWFEQDAIEDADGMISPAELPYDVVTLRLSPDAGGEQVSALPVKYSALTGLIFLHPIEKQSMGVKFSVLDASTVATGAAGALLAKKHQGKWVGETGRYLLALDVRRPVRRLQLERPLSLVHLSVNELLVRPLDDRGDDELTTKVTNNPDELTVVGKPTSQAARLLVVIGRDHLGRCRSIQYRRKTQKIVLTCPQSSQAPAGDPAT